MSTITHKSDVSRAVNLALFLVFMFLNLTFAWNPPRWKGLGDSPDYLRQSQISLWSREFYAPHSEPHFFPRPFTTPLLFKLAHSDPDLIIQAQKFIHVLAAFFIVSSLLPFFNRTPAKYLLMLGTYALMGWWNILGWTILLLSESLSISLFFCWLASFLVLLRRRKAWAFAIHLVVTVLFSFTRDTWPFVLVAFYTLAVFVAYWLREPLFKKLLALLVFSLALLFVQMSTARIGERYRLPVLNTILVRIVPNDEYREWFARRGMPLADKLKMEYPAVDADSMESLSKTYPIYWDHSYQELFDWIVSRGKSTYVRFLLTHPAYTLLLQEDPAKLRRILARNLFYTGEAGGYSAWIERVFPLFNPVVTLLLCVVLAILAYRRRDMLLSMPALLALVFLFNACLSYNGDAFEVPRHMFFTGIMVEFVGFLGLALLIDSCAFLRLLSAVKGYLQEQWK